MVFTDLVKLTVAAPHYNASAGDENALDPVSVADQTECFGIPFADRLSVNKCTVCAVSIFPGSIVFRKETDIVMYGLYPVIKSVADRREGVKCFFKLRRQLFRVAVFRKHRNAIFQLLNLPDIKPVFLPALRDCLDPRTIHVDPHGFFRVIHDEGIVCGLGNGSERL